MVIEYVEAASQEFFRRAYPTKLTGGSRVRVGEVAPGR
jgi:hypothetical protein